MIGCAHIVIKPDTVVNIPVMPSREDVIPSPSPSAKTVVGPAFVKMLVHP